MKSKEALERIQTRTYPYFLGLYEQEDYVEDIKTIERDLALLELLKSKHVDIAELKEDGNVIIYNLSMMKQDLLTEEEFKKLKEWMEDAKE